MEMDLHLHGGHLYAWRPERSTQDEAFSFISEKAA
jgi:hypothetical protein